MARIMINGISVDPMKRAPALAATRLIGADLSQSNFIPVRAKSPPTPRDRQKPADFGAEILEYVPEDT